MSLNRDIINNVSNTDVIMLPYNINILVSNWHY